MSMSVFLILLIAVSVCLSLVMMIAWRIERRTGNAGWVDVCWTFGVGLVSAAAALAALIQQQGSLIRVLLVAGLILLWSLRLGSHLVRRTRGIKDDPRYHKMKEDWGAGASSGMFKLLQSQALVSIPLAMSVALAAWSPVTVFRPQDVLALVVGLIAIAGEGLADSQLRAFRAKPENKDRFCDVGLWNWSRHPNYFFEWFGWLAYALFAMDFAGAYYWGWLALSGALCMYWLLNHVSGIPPLEEHMLKKYGDRFRAYCQRTSAFFPLPPAPSRNKD